MRAPTDGYCFKDASSAVCFTLIVNTLHVMFALSDVLWVESVSGKECHGFAAVMCMKSQSLGVWQLFAGGVLTAVSSVKAASELLGSVGPN